MKCASETEVDVKRLGVGPVDGVPGPQHAAVELLDGPSHGPIVANPPLPAGERVGVRGAALDKQTEDLIE